MPSLVVWAFSVLAASAAPERQDIQRFQSAFLQGEALYQRQAYSEALKHFAEAEKVFPTPETAFNLAKCHEKLRNLGQTSYYFRAYLKRDPKALDAKEVEGQLTLALSKAAALGQGYLEIEAPGAQAISVGVQTFSRVPVAIFLSAGVYKIEVHYANKHEVKQLEVQVGQETTQTFLSATPTETLAQKQSLDLSNTPSPKWDKRPWHTASYYVLGAAAAILVSGAFMGSLSYTDANLLQRHGSLTVLEAQSLTDSANSKGRSANTLFGVGTAAAVIGAGLFVFTLPEPGLKESSP